MPSRVSTENWLKWRGEYENQTNIAVGIIAASLSLVDWDYGFVSSVHCFSQCWFAVGFSGADFHGGLHQPPLLDLMVYIVGVRFFGISRALLRYSERYVFS